METTIYAGEISYNKWQKQRAKALNSQRKRSKKAATENLKLVDARIFYIMSIVLAAVIISCISVCMFTKSLYVDQISTLRSEIAVTTAENVTLRSQVSLLQDNYSQEYNTVASMLQDVSEIAYTLDQENQQLNTELNELQTKIEEYEKREELFDSYEYALIRSDNTRTDITYERLENLESLVEEQGMSEESMDLILSLAMSESTGTENAKNPASTATGFGQLLEGTARYIYEKLMGNGRGTYHHSMALDGDLNLEMMTYYIAYLGDKYNNNLSLVINEYRGLNDPGYNAKVNRYLAKAGTSLNKVKIYDSPGG